MIKKSLLCMALLALPHAAGAQVVLGAGYMNVGYDSDELDISLAALTASLGYKLVMGPRFYLVPELRVAMGITEDTIESEAVEFDLELDAFYGATLRGQYEFDTGLYIFAYPSYTATEVSGKTDAGGFDYSITADSEDFGYGAGLGFNPNETVGVEASWEDIDNTHLLLLTARFNL